MNNQMITNAIFFNLRDTFTAFFFWSVQVIRHNSHLPFDLAMSKGNSGLK